MVSSLSVISLCKNDTFFPFSKLLGILKTGDTRGQVANRIRNLAKFLDFSLATVVAVFSY